MQISGSRLVSVRLSIVCIELSGISVAELLWHRRLCAVLAMAISCCVGVSLWFMIEVFFAFPVEFKRVSNQTIGLFNVSRYGLLV